MDPVVTSMAREMGSVLVVGRQGRWAGTHVGRGLKYLRTQGAQGRYSLGTGRTRYLSCCGCPRHGGGGAVNPVLVAPTCSSTAATASATNSGGLKRAARTAAESVPVVSQQRRRGITVRLVPKGD